MGFWCFQHFFESFNVWTTEEWVSEIVSLSTCGIKAEFDRFFRQDEQLSHLYHDSLLHPCPLFSLVGSRGGNGMSGKYWSGLYRYLYHRQRRKLYHCFPGQHKQRAWEFFDKLPCAKNQVLKNEHSHCHALFKNTQIFGWQFSGKLVDSFITNSSWLYVIY